MTRRVPLPPLPDPSERRGEDVARMFGAIAPTYDFLNHLLSMNLDRSWRRKTAAALSPVPGELCLDLCTGTGDLALKLIESTGAKVLGADLTRPMLVIAQRKARRRGVALPLIQADALALPVRDGCLSGVTVAFGVRNFEDLGLGLAEMARVLRPGGRLCILEFSEPEGRLFGPLFRFYFRRILPLIGGLFRRGYGAYAYLPATVRLFPGRGEFAGKLEQAGLRVLQQGPLTFGVATIHLAEKKAAV